MSPQKLGDAHSYAGCVLMHIKRQYTCYLVQFNRYGAWQIKHGQTESSVAHASAGVELSNLSACGK